MAQYTVEDMVQHVAKTFNNRREAYQYKFSMEIRFPDVTFQLYPVEPISPFPGMCERCEQHPAERGDFLCAECNRQAADEIMNDK